LHLGVVDRGPIGFDRGVESRGASSHRVDLLASHNASLGQILVARGL
jgi:hypothetical protein